MMENKRPRIECCCSKDTCAQSMEFHSNGFMTNEGYFELNEESAYKLIVYAVRVVQALRGYEGKSV